MVWLLKIPGLMLVGGLGLVWVAYKLLADQGEGEHDGPMASTFWGAMRTIIVADGQAYAFSADGEARLIATMTGTMARPSRPSVRFTELPAATTTKPR